MTKQYIELGTLILALVVLFLLLVFVRNPVGLIINSVVAIVILLLLNMVLKVGIPINLLTVLVVAIGGIIGLLLILLLRYYNLAFGN